jgi:hypothetical protein
MSKREELLNDIEHLQLTTDQLDKKDVPFIPHWNYELLADFILQREQTLLEEFLKIVIEDVPWRYNKRLHETIQKHKEE